MFAKSLQWRDGDDLAVDVDDDHAGGGWSPPEVDSGGVSKEIHKVLHAHIMHSLKNDNETGSRLCGQFSRRQSLQAEEGSLWTETGS